MSYQERRKNLRIKSKDDPLLPVAKPVVNILDGVEVGDGWPSKEPTDLTYASDRFDNPLLTSIHVANRESPAK